MSGDFAVGFAFGKKRPGARLPGGQTSGTFADRPTSAGRGEDCADLLPEVVETKLTKHRIRFIQQFKGASVVTRRAPRKEHQRSMIVYLAEKGSEPSTATQLGRAAQCIVRTRSAALLTARRGRTPGTRPHGTPVREAQGRRPHRPIPLS